MGRITPGVDSFHEPYPSPRRSKRRNRAAPNQDPSREVDRDRHIRRIMTNTINMTSIRSTTKSLGIVHERRTSMRRKSRATIRDRHRMSRQAITGIRKGEEYFKKCGFRVTRMSI